MAQEVFKEKFNNSEKLIVNSEKLKLEKAKIGDLVEIISGYPFSSKLYNKFKKGLGVVTIKNVQDGNFITKCDSFIEERKIPKNMNNECLIGDGDVLLSLTGNVGRVCFVYGGKYLLNQRVAKLKPKNSNDLAFIYFLFRQSDMQNLLINMAKGSAQPNLSPVETGEIEITVPAREILDKLNKVINPIYEELIRLKVENQKLATLRDLLLPKLMSGEIRV
jgi:type I restriction enzyme S subunit